MSMFESIDWQIVNSVSGWVAALGSVTASITALYLAMRGEKEKVIVSETWVLSDEEYQYGVNIVNRSAFPVYITSIDIIYTEESELGRAYIGIDGKNGIRLEYGQSIRKVSKQGYKNIPKVVYVTTSTGSVVRIKISRRVKFALGRMVEKLQQQRT